MEVVIPVSLAGCARAYKRGGFRQGTAMRVALTPGPSPAGGCGQRTKNHLATTQPAWYLLSSETFQEVVAKLGALLEARKRGSAKPQAAFTANP